MNSSWQGYTLSDDRTRLQLEWLVPILHSTYWANARTEDRIRRSIEGSLCFGVFEESTGRQVGFARVVTDFATFGWVCDIVIDPAHRGAGLGKRLVAAIVDDPRLSKLSLLLGTRDAHGLYEQYGFVRHESMRRAAPS
ncbi:GNAT family N-acetyltransferase [Opitutaceae bacterium EW11]|nr:GNAT family N-acetyltransferase [Opitutaceae bacterium EW11]